MENEDSKQILEKNGITEPSTTPAKFLWLVNITSIDLSDQNIVTLDEKVIFPENLLELNISNNKLLFIPAIISKLKKLKSLNLSNNSIEYFDETPSFCQTIERLDLSTNNLQGPPLWIWTETPKNLYYVNLSCNTQITKILIHLEELLQYKTSVLEIDLYNCGFNNKTTELLASFQGAKTINFGTINYCHHGANVMGEAPNKGLAQCSDIERLNLSNTSIHSINSSIDKLMNLRELTLACNNIPALPNEFCNLINLETCVLTSNLIIYLPDYMYKLKNLKRLHLDCNKLCMLPERLNELNLKSLDLYDNCLYEILEDYSHLEEFDVALNYIDEPDEDSYLEKKIKIRLLDKNRIDGRKPELIQDEDRSEDSFEEYDEEEYKAMLNGEVPVLQNSQDPNDQSRASSPEDWDSDSYWIPHEIKLPSKTIQPWVRYIQQKMREGNFCPIDAHVVSISEQVMYNKKVNPQVNVQCAGQFDDYSSDDS